MSVPDVVAPPTGTAESDEWVAKYRQRLPFLTGLRGLAAFGVLIGHIALFAYGLAPGSWMHFGGLFRVLTELLVPLRYPNAYVYLFLFVSGFSLFYSEDRRRRRGRSSLLGAFAKRRGWRILPVYYAALGFGLFVTKAVPFSAIRSAAFLKPSTTGAGLLAHLFLLHDVHPPWLFQINSPLWSLSYEVQLYPLFPLLYWACRRYHASLVCGIAIATDVIIHIAAPTLFIFMLLRWFALGILAASIYASPIGRRLPVPALLVAGLAALAASIAKPWDGTNLIGVAMLGAAFVLLSLVMAERPGAHWANLATWPVFRWFGLRSYSVYAFHYPVLWLVHAALSRAAISPAARTLLWFPVSLVASLAVCELGYRLFEMPSVRRAAGVR